MIQICAQHNHCTGCGACVNICPKAAVELKESDCGFVYPSIDEAKCIECGLCQKACAAVFCTQQREPVEAYACTVKNRDTLMKSSSGGVFSALAEYVLEQQGAICGCVYDENLKPVHICSGNEADFFRMRKSKYVQSDTGYVYRDVKRRLEAGQLVLFTGTPCQVAGLKGFLGKEYENLICVDLVCHGVPSYGMFKAFLNYLEEKYKTKIKDFDFRSKKYNWQRYTMEFADSNGRVKNIGKTDEFYLYAFSTGNIIRPECFVCRYATRERVGDVTIGDFWGHEGLKLACDRVNGISVCMINNAKAQKLVPILKEKMTMDAVDYNVVVDGNTCLRQPTKKGTKWELYMQAYRDGNVAAMAKRYQKANKKRRLRGKIKLLVPLRVFRLIKKLHL